MKKKKKYKSPQIIVMDYEMEEPCLVSVNSPNQHWDKDAKKIIPIVDYESENDF